MDGVSLMERQERLLKQLAKCVDDMSSLGAKMAMADANYYKEKAKQTLLAKDNGTQMSIIESIVNGNNEVITARMERTIAECAWEQNKERINATKRALDIVEGHIAMEWGRRD